MAPYDSRYLEFFRLFNLEEFFEAHEVLEDLWRKTETEERNFYQALIQLAAALVHVQRHNPESAQNLYLKAQKRFSGYPDQYLGIQISHVLGLVHDSLKEKKGFPRFPLPSAAA